MCARQVSAAEDAKQLLQRFTEQEDKQRAVSNVVSKKNPFVICFGGKFKTGKSSLINALLGEELLPTKATTATTVLTRIIRGDTFRVWKKENGSTVLINRETAKELILNEQNSMVEIIFEVPLPWLPPYVELRDTPGTEDNLVLESIADSAVQDADIFICVFDAGHLLDEQEKRRTPQLHRQLGGNVIYVVNRTNVLGSVEDVKEVRNVASRFIANLKHPDSTMGKLFVLCSKPGMVYLDGFDEWLKALIQLDNMPKLNELKAIAARGQMQTMLVQHCDKAKEQLVGVKEELKTAEAAHKASLAEQLTALKAAAKDAADAVRGKESAIAQKLFDLTNLEAAISSCKGSDAEWQNKYAEKTKQKAKEFFTNKFNSLRKSSEYADALIDSSWITNTITSSKFPGPTTREVKASTGETLWGAGICGTIGFFLGGPWGAAAGAAIGGALGGSSTTEDISVSTTMNHIKNYLLPALKASFKVSVENAAKSKERSILAQESALESGYESTIQTLNSVKKQLEAYCAKQEAGFTAGLVSSPAAR